VHVRFDDEPDPSLRPFEAERSGPPKHTHGIATERVELCSTRGPT
jgi:hypothetical protein